MEPFYEKILEVVANYGIFAIMFSIALILLYRKYESDIQRYREKEDKVDMILLDNQKNIVEISQNTAKILGDISESQKQIQTGFVNMNTELKVFLEVQKHINGKILKRRQE